MQLLQQQLQKNVLMILKVHLAADSVSQRTKPVYTSSVTVLKQEAFEKCWARSSPGLTTVARRHCRTPPAHRCPQRRRRQRQRVTEGTAMAP